MQFPYFEKNKNKAKQNKKQQKKQKQKKQKYSHLVLTITSLGTIRQYKAFKDRKKSDNVHGLENVQGKTSWLKYFLAGLGGAFGCASNW